MTEPRPPEYGTLVIAALLILALLFAGAWISAYVSTDGVPHNLWQWYGGAAAAIVGGAVLYYLLGRGR
jgi:hypothetical protein